VLLSNKQVFDPKLRNVALQLANLLGMTLRPGLQLAIGNEAYRLS